MSRRNYQVREVGDYLDEYCSIAAEGLLVSDPGIWKRYVARVGVENLRGVFDGARLAGGLAFYRMGQWFGGKRLDCAGYSGVSINPVDRGQGACGELLRKTLLENYHEGIPIASLYASTQTLYRSVGFEHAGLQIKYSIPIHSIGKGDRSLPAHRFSEPSFELLDVVAENRARATNGNLARTTGLWERRTQPYDGGATNTYVFGELDAPEGYVILLSSSRDDGVPQTLACTDVAANTPAAWARLMALLFDHRSMCDRFSWFGQPQDPLHYLSNEQLIEVPECMRWMLRIVNVPKSLSLRGYAEGVTETIDFKVLDPLISENDGHWRLHVREGQASVEPGGDGHLELNIRALAPMYSSLLSATQLKALGVLQCNDPSQVQAADRVFSGPSPWMTEIF